MSGLEIDRMLSLSTAHLRASTCNGWLHNPVGVTAYEKTGGSDAYGWIVYVGDVDSYNAERNGEEGGQMSLDSDAVPGELKVIAAFARDHGCSWLNIDRDADQVDGLVVFDW